MAAEPLHTGAAARLLREAGETAFEHFRESIGFDRGEVGSAGFRTELGTAREAQRWGLLARERVQPAIGPRCSPAWAESESESRSEAARCAFTVGMSSTIFGHVAGARVQVLEVRCRSCWDAHAAFDFGSSEAVRRLETRLGRGEDFGAAVERLLRPGPANRPGR